MIGAVICTHQNLAQALLETAQMIVGAFPGVSTVGVKPGDGPEEIRDRLTAAMKEVDQGDGILILCDMFGGTPSNLSLSFLSDKVEVVTGVNLPMLLRLYTSREGPLSEVASSTREYGRENILVAGELLRPRGGSH